MPREETIKVKIDRSEADQSLKALKSAADAIKKELGSIKVGDAAKTVAALAKASKDAAAADATRAKAAKDAANADILAAKASKEAANADLVRAKVSKEIANADAARAKASKELSNSVIQAAKATKEAANADSARAKASKEAANADAARAKASKEVANANAAHAKAEKELNNATNAYLKAQVTAQNVVTSRLRTAREAVNVIKAESSAQKEAANAEAAKSRAQKAAVQTQEAINKSISGGMQYVSNYTNALKNFATQLIGFYGVTSILRKAFTEMKAMNDELVTYRKVTGASAADMQKMQSAAYSAAKNYGQSPSDFLASAATMARAGYKENSAAMAELATKTQLVGDMTADQAGKFLIAVDAAYKYQGNIKQLSSVLDSANEIDNKYATTIEKISEGMTLVASVAATAEVPIEQLMAALGTMTAVTQREGSEAARGLRYILLHAMGDTTTEIEDGVTATAEGIQTLNEAVMQYGDEAAKTALQAGKMINPMEKIVALQKAWKEGTLSKESLYNIGLKVAGQRQYNMFMALIQNPDMYNSMMKDIANSAGSADKEWQAMMDSWSKKLEKLKATFTELVNNTISTDFIKSLIDAGTGALEFAGNLENLATMATGAYVAVKALASGLGNLSKNNAFGGFNAASIGIGLAITAIGAIKSAYEDNQRKILEESTKAAENAQKEIQKYNSVLEIQKRYQEIVSDGIQEEKGEMNELKSLQDQLNKLVGAQGTAVDLVNGKYEQQKKLLESLSESQRQMALTEAKIAVSTTLSKWNEADLNGSATGSYTGLTLPSNMSDSFLSGYKYLYKVYDSYNDIAYLHFKKGDTTEDIIGLIDELTDFQGRIATLAANGSKAENGLKSVAEQNSNFVLSLASFADTVNKYGQPHKSAVESLEELNNLMLKTNKAADGTGDAGKSAADGLSAAANSAITLANAIDTATAAKKKFDDAMKTSKADAFNDYTKAYETFKKEMDAGRVNSTAFYAAAEMLMGSQAFAATGGNSADVVKAVTGRSAGDSGSAYDAWKILSGTYKNRKTGEVIEGFGFAELLRQTKGWGKNKITDANGNIVIPALTSDQIAQIANQWHIDPAFLMAAWNTFDQYDKNGTRQADDLMAKKSEEAADAAEGAGDAEKTLAQTTVTASSAMDAASTSATNLASAMNNAADAANGFAGDGGKGEGAGAGEGSDATGASGTQGGEAGEDKVISTGLSDIVEDEIERVAPVISKEEADKIIKDTGDAIDAIYREDINSPFTNPFKFDDVGAARAEAEREAELAKQRQAAEAAKKAAEEEAKKAAEEAAKAAEGSAGEPQGDNAVEPKSAGENWISPELRKAADELKAQREEEAKREAEKKAFRDLNAQSWGFSPELEKIFAEEEIAEAAGEKDGEAYAQGFQAGEKAVSESEPSIVEQTVDESATSGEEAGQQFGAEYWKAMLQAADRDAQGLYVPDHLRKQLEKDLTENGGDLWAVIEKYKKALAAAQGESADLGKELGKPEEKEVEVEVEDEKAKTEIKKLTADERKRISIELMTRPVPNGGGGGSGNMMAKYASGTRSHAGGPALVNDGSGPELIVQGGQAFIAGGGKPTIVGLQKGAKVFTAGETRQIFGGSIPAYKDGSTAYDSVSFKDIAYSSDDSKKTVTIKKAKTSSKSSKSSKKVDEKAFSNLASVVDYIIGRIGTALDEQLEIIDKQIDAMKAAREAAEEQNKLEELQKNVTDALSERTVRYLGEDGKWHWMADQKKVNQAQTALKEYEDELAFNAQIKELEDQKTALQDEYNQITKMWSEIKDGVATPTTSLTSAINAVLSGGTAQQKTGATAVKTSLIDLMTGGAYTGNYKEALSSISKAASGKPIMPNSGNPTLASLIALSGAGATESSITEALQSATGSIASMTGSGSTLVGGNQTNINYFIDGIKLGEGMENRTLSEIMGNLSVYTNTGVN